MHQTHKVVRLASGWRSCYETTLPDGTIFSWEQATSRPETRWQRLISRLRRSKSRYALYGTRSDEKTGAFRRVSVSGEHSVWHLDQTKGYYSGLVAVSNGVVTITQGYIRRGRLIKTTRCEHIYRGTRLPEVEEPNLGKIVEFRMRA